MRRDHSKGITLVELLVSIGIVGTMALLLLPVSSLRGPRPGRRAA